MQALLDITEYHVDNVEIRANPDYKECDVASGNIKVDFDIKQNNDNPLLFMITLFIELNNSKKALSSAEYKIKFDITGYFSFSEGTPEETVDKMIAPSGLSILYGVARGVLAQITGNFKHGKFILPTLNFIEIIKDKFKDMEENSVLPPKKKKAV